ncbi:MAG: flavin reductase family protein [Victivallaceae bacterium]|nr:flavin reductase family protein [Victivallaceae bacterium]
MQKQVTAAEAWTRKYPEQVVLAITKNEQDRINLMAIGWICTASDEPPMFIMGIDEHAYTLELLKKNQEFVIAYPSVNMAEETLYLGTTHGHAIDKGKECGLTFSAASKVNVPLLSDAVANFECRLVNIVRPGDCPLVIGEIVAAHVNTDKSLKRLYNLAQGYKLGGL